MHLHVPFNREKMHGDSSYVSPLCCKNVRIEAQIFFGSTIDQISSIRLQSAVATGPIYLKVECVERLIKLYFTTNILY